MDSILCLFSVGAILAYEKTVYCMERIEGEKEWERDKRQF